MIKSHLEKHNLTPKHLRMINGISSVSSVSSASDDIIDAIEVYGNDIAFLKAYINSTNAATYPHYYPKSIRKC
jgi:hypothetical protein